MERISLEKAFHPFIAGAYNRLVQELSLETGARISIPPPSLPKDEIVITGEKEAVALALARIRAIYEEKVKEEPHVCGKWMSEGPAQLLNEIISEE